MKPDDVFVLLLIVVCVVAIAALAVHSRRQQRLPIRGGSHTEDETVMPPRPVVNEEPGEPVTRRQQRRR